MKVSVVVPAYNEEKNLPNLLASLKNQNFPRHEFEILVVDNNSADATREVACAFGARVVRESRQGITYARDTGVRAARGDIIVGTDADCILPKYFLSSVYSRFKHDKKLFGLCGSITLPDAPMVIRLGAFLLSAYGDWYSKFFTKTPIVWALNFSFKRKRFLSIGGYNLHLPLLERGINTDGSDEIELGKRFMRAGGTVIFDKHLTLSASGRRFNKGRLLYWFLIEHVFAFSINRMCYKLFGFVIPVPSYYKRKRPTGFERFMLNTSFASVISVLFLVPLLSLYTIQDQTFDRHTFAKSYKKYQRVLVSKMIDPIRNSTVVKNILNLDNEESNMYTTPFLSA